MPFEPPERFNIVDYFLLDRLTEGAGDRVAVRVGEDAWTYVQVAELADRFARALRSHGVRQEERVLIALPDGIDFVGAFFGVLELGAVVVMVNPQLEAEKLADLFDYSRARLAIIDSDGRQAFEAAAEKAEWRPEIVESSALTAAEPGQEPRVVAATHRDDPAIWLFSGGTTGRPKAVVQTHRSFANTTELYAKGALGYGPEDVTLSVPKLYFGYATGSNLLFPFAVGGSAVLFPEHPTAEILFGLIERHRPTILVNVPTMINQMVGHPEAAAADLSSLRFATSAGEALPVPLYERWKETFGVELLDGLGTAEMWHIFVTNRPGDVSPGTLGRAVEGFDIKVADDEGAEVGPGEVGRMWVRGESRALGYWQNLPQTAEAFRGEWFVGGDLIERDVDGYVTYCGRSDDVLKVSGKWFAPSELESCLMQHPGVAECAVVGMTDDRGLTKPCAFVIANGGGEGLEEALKEHALAHLQPYKHPRRVFVVEALPRTHLGKIDRGRLKAEFTLDS